jgi:hypothetical protein
MRVKLVQFGINAYIAIQKSFGRLEAGPTVEPASSRWEKIFLDKYTTVSFSPKRTIVRPL